VYVSGEELQTRMISAGTPARLAEFMAQMESSLARGALEIQSDQIQPLVGSPAAPPDDFISSYLKGICVTAAQPT